MLNFKQWDFLAGSYIPILAIISLVTLVFEVNKFGLKHIIKPTFGIAASAVMVYFIMVIDRYFSIWPRFGLDYSTHTALALVFVVYLSFRDSFSAMLVGQTAVAYGYLMIYQQYHSLADIALTTLVVVPIFALLQLIINRQHKPPVVELSEDCD